MTDVTVTMLHIRTIPGFSSRNGYCARGARAWFQRHGLDWSTFLRDGVSASVLEATGDGMALALVAHARQESARG